MSGNFLKDYFTFSPRERLGFIVVCLAVLGVYIIPKLTSSRPASSYIQADSSLVKAIDTLQRRAKTEPASEEYSYTEEAFSKPPSKNYQKPAFIEGALFSFNPNELPAEGWQKLGLSEKLTKILINYRNKGGHFYKKEDILKIWGMPPAFYERVKDYISLPAPPAPQETKYQSSYASEVKYEKAEKKIAIVNINDADTNAFIALPGIGNRLSNRIINFRDKLGGFYSVDQVSETYGLSDSTFQLVKKYLVLGSGEVRKISINKATKEEMKQHPYIRWKIANAIEQYRTQHGPFNSLDDLKKINIIDDAVFDKIVHYLTL
jgi:competence protein ComEA